MCFLVFRLFVHVSRILSLVSYLSSLLVLPLPSLLGPPFSLNSFQISTLLSSPLIVHRLLQVVHRSSILYLFSSFSSFICQHISHVSFSSILAQLFSSVSLRSSFFSQFSLTIDFPLLSIDCLSFVTGHALFNALSLFSQFFDFHVLAHVSRLRLPCFSVSRLSSLVSPFLSFLPRLSKVLFSLSVLLDYRVSSPLY